MEEEEINKTYHVKKKTKIQNYDTKKIHEFWSKQSIKQLDDIYKNLKLEDIKIIDKEIKIESNIDEELSENFTEKFKLYELDLNDDESFEKVSSFLKDHYISDKSEKFRYAYSKECLKWVIFLFFLKGYLFFFKFKAINPPNQLNLLGALRDEENDEIISIISSTPIHLNVANE
jgi:hypothetical protein